MVDLENVPVMLSLTGVQCVIGVVGCLYGIVLLIRKDRSFFYLFFLLGIWALGATRLWPAKEFSPLISEATIVLAMVCIVGMLIMHKRSLAGTSHKKCEMENASSGEPFI